MQFSFNFFTIFSAVFIYLAPSGAKYCEKRVGRYWEKLWKGFGKVLEKAKLSSRDQVGCRRSLPGFAGEPTDDGSACGRRGSGAPLQIQGGCASSRLDHGLKV